MKLIAAYLLACLGTGSSRPPAGKVAEILRASDIEFDESQLNALVSELAAKGDIDEVIAEGKEKFASVPSVGVAAGAGPAGAGAAAQAVAEPEPEPEEEEDDDMGFSLFD